MIQIDVTRYTIIQLEKAIEHYRELHKSSRTDIQDYSTMISVLCELYLKEKHGKD